MTQLDTNWIETSRLFKNVDKIVLGRDTFALIRPKAVVNLLQNFGLLMEYKTKCDSLNTVSSEVINRLEQDKVSLRQIIANSEEQLSLKDNQIQIEKDITKSTRKQWIRNSFYIGGGSFVLGASLTTILVVIAK